MFTYPFLILQQLLKTITELKEVDWYLDQYKTGDKLSLLVTCPAAYIQFMPVETWVHGNKIQRAEVEIVIHLVTENVMDSGKRMQKTVVLDHANLFDRINTLLQGYSSKLSVLPAFAALLNTSQDQTVLTSMSRSNITPAHTIDKAKMLSMQTFKCVVYDHSATKLYTHPTPALQVDTDFI